MSKKSKQNKGKRQSNRVGQVFPRSSQKPVPRPITDSDTQVPTIAGEEVTAALVFHGRDLDSPTSTSPTIQINLSQPASPSGIESGAAVAISLFDRLGILVSMPFIYLIVLLLIFAGFNQLEFHWHTAVKFIACYFGGLLLLKGAQFIWKPTHK